MKKYTLHPNDHYRLITISDVHGHVNEFRSLIKKLDLCEDDILVILGDFVNKGYASYETLREVMALDIRKNTFVLKGNHELKLQNIISSYERFETVQDFMTNENYETLFHSMLRHRDKSFSSFPSFYDAYNFIREEFQDEIDFISNLNIMAENNDFLFVHGGYSSEFAPSCESDFLKYDHYDELSGVNHKTIVVGHWPASNLRQHVICNEPYINSKKKIISIDGGLGIKTTGELNAFIIEKSHGSISYSSIQENSFKKRSIVKEHIFEKEDQIYINYPHFDIELLHKDHETSLCRHIHSGMNFTIFNHLLDTSGETPQMTMTYINNFLNLKVGEHVHEVMTKENHSLVKYKGEFGWVMKEQLR